MAPPFAGVDTNNDAVAVEKPFERLEPQRASGRELAGSGAETERTRRKSTLSPPLRPTPPPSGDPQDYLA